MGCVRCAVRRFVGIVTKYFEVVHNELAVADMWKRSVSSYGATVWKRAKVEERFACDGGAITQRVCQVLWLRRFKKPVEGSASDRLLKACVYPWLRVRGLVLLGLNAPMCALVPCVYVTATLRMRRTLLPWDLWSPCV